MWSQQHNFNQVVLTSHEWLTLSYIELQSWRCQQFLLQSHSALPAWSSLSVRRARSNLGPCKGHGQNQHLNGCPNIGSYKTKHDMTWCMTQEYCLNQVATHAHPWQDTFWSGCKIWSSLGRNTPKQLTRGNDLHVPLHLTSVHVEQVFGRVRPGLHGNEQFKAWTTLRLRECTSPNMSIW